MLLYVDVVLCVHMQAYFINSVILYLTKCYASLQVFYNSVLGLNHTRYILTFLDF
jgi:hypothetical protein